MANEVTIKTLNQKHLELIELMISEPTLKGKDLAERLSLSESWISTIKHSDLFQEEYEKRLAEHRRIISENIVAKTEDVVNLTLDRMKTILDDADQPVSLGRLGQIYDITTRRLFPDNRGPGVVVNNYSLADPEAIRKARERAERLRTGNDVVDVVALPEPA